MFRKSNDASRKRTQDRRRDKQPERRTRNRREMKLLAGLAAGVIGGIVATWALDRYQEGALEATRRRENTTGTAPIVRYTIGALAGGAYGLAAEILPVVRRGYGTGYSNLLFLGGSEAVLPWFNRDWFNRGPRQKFQPASGGLSAPLVYGAVLETTRRILRWLL